MKKMLMAFMFVISTGQSTRINAIIPEILALASAGATGFLMNTTEGGTLFQEDIKKELWYMGIDLYYNIQEEYKKAGLFDTVKMHLNNKNETWSIYTQKKFLKLIQYLYDKPVALTGTVAVSVGLATYITLRISSAIIRKLHSGIRKLHSCISKKK